MQKNLTGLAQTKLVTKYMDSFCSFLSLDGNHFNTTTFSNLFISCLKLHTRVTVAAARAFRSSDTSEIAIAAL